MTRYHLAIYGTSLLLSAVAESLLTVPDLRLFHIEPPAADAATRLRAFHPEIVLVDQGVEPRYEASLLLTLLHTCPDIPIVGLDTECSLATVLSGHKMASGSLADL